MRELRLVVRQIILRWLAFTPADDGDLASLLDEAALGTDCKRTIDNSLRAFFAKTPPKDIRVDWNLSFGSAC